MDGFKAGAESEEEFNESDNDCGVLEKKLSSHPGNPALCNLPSHSALPQRDCSRNEKPFWSGRRRLLCRVALVVRASQGSSEVKRIMITP